MQTVKVSDASGAVLDWMVAKCEFPSHVLNFVKGSKHNGTYEEYTKPRFAWVKNRPLFVPCSLAEADRLLEIETNSYYCPSVSWGIGGPIIERERIDLVSQYPSGWTACDPDANARGMRGDTALTAAMRCYVCSKLGDTVEVPEELPV